MPCLKSKPAWSSTLPNANGRHPITFRAPKKNKTPDYYIPCGKCEGCAILKRRAWGIRMYHESCMHERNCFITLTYDDDHLVQKINRKDPLYFIRRLRHHSSTPIRYFLTGEYGEKTNRPHYHAILFGEDWLGGAYDIKPGLYGNEIINRIWRKGDCSISQFNMGTALYTAGYVNKKLGDTDTFSIMSRFPPLGQSWVQKHHDNLRRIKTVQIEGKSYPIPPVYLKWLEGVEQYDDIKKQAKEKVVTYTDQQLRAKGLNMQSNKQHRVEKEKH